MITAKEVTEDIFIADEKIQDARDRLELVAGNILRQLEHMASGASAHEVAHHRMNMKWIGRNTYKEVHISYIREFVVKAHNFLVEEAVKLRGEENGE